MRPSLSVTDVVMMIAGYCGSECEPAREEALHCVFICVCVCVCVCMYVCV